MQKYRISDEVLTQEISGETVLLDLSQESYFGLDTIGTRIWQLLQEQKDLAEIKAILLNEYEVEEQQLQKDLGDLVEQLLEAELIVPNSD